MEGGARRLGTRLVALGENTQNLKRLASSTPALYSALLSGWLPGRQECVRGGMKTGWKKNKRNTHRFLPSLSESLVAVSKSGGGGVGRGGDWRGDRVKETPCRAHSSSSKKTQNLLSSHLVCLQRAACLRYRQDQLSADVAWPILHSFRRLVTPEWLSHRAQLGPSVPGAATCQTALPPPVQTRNYDESCSGRSRSGGAGRNYTNTPLGHIWQ